MTRLLPEKLDILPGPPQHGRRFGSFWLVACDHVRLMVAEFLTNAHARCQSAAGTERPGGGDVGCCTLIAVSIIKLRGVKQPAVMKLRLCASKVSTLPRARASAD